MTEPEEPIEEDLLSTLEQRYDAMLQENVNLIAKVKQLETRLQFQQERYDREGEVASNDRERLEDGIIAACKLIGCLGVLIEDGR